MRYRHLSILCLVVLGIGIIIYLSYTENNRRLLEMQIEQDKTVSTSTSSQLPREIRIKQTSLTGVVQSLDGNSFVLSTKNSSGEKKSYVIRFDSSTFFASKPKVLESGLESITLQNPPPSLESVIRKGSTVEVLTRDSLSEAVIFALQIFGAEQ